MVGGGTIRENDWSCQAVPVQNHWEWVLNIDRATGCDTRRRSDPQETPPSLCRGRLTVPYPNPKVLFVRPFKPHRVEPNDLRKRAKHLRRCKEAVWRRWRNEYLRGLRERHNQQHGRKTSTPKVGEVVIIKSDEKNRGKWKLGVVEW